MRGNEKRDKGLLGGSKKAREYDKSGKEAKVGGKETLTPTKQGGSLLHLNPSASKRKVLFVNAS